MTLHIILTQSEVTLKLTSNKGVIDLEKALYYHNLSNVLTPYEVSRINKVGFIVKGKQTIYAELRTGLISTLDKLLKRNRLDSKSLKSYKLLSNLGTDSTSYKLASAFIAALKFRS